MNLQSTTGWQIAEKVFCAMFFTPIPTYQNKKLFRTPNRKFVYFLGRKTENGFLA